MSEKIVPLYRCRKTALLSIFFFDFMLSCWLISLRSQRQYGQLIFALEITLPQLMQGKSMEGFRWRENQKIFGDRFRECDTHGQVLVPVACLLLNTARL